MNKKSCWNEKKYGFLLNVFHPDEVDLRTIRSRVVTIYEHKIKDGLQNILCKLTVRGIWRVAYRLLLFQIFGPRWNSLRGGITTYFLSPSNIVEILRIC